MGNFGGGAFGPGLFGIGGGVVASYADERQALSRMASVLVTITLDTCQRVFGTSPCLATGTPCYNTWPTCTFRSAYLAGPKDYTFCPRTTPAPIPGRIIRPYIEEFRYLGQEILPNEALTLNQTLTLTMADEPDNDVGVDPYRTSPTQRSAPGGSVANTATGTFWAKLKARNTNYKNRRVTVKTGFVAPGFTEEIYQVEFLGVLDNIAIEADGTVKLTVKGLLQLTDTDFPKKTDGKLSAELAADGVSLALTPWSGVDRSVTPPATQYAATGWLKIDTEILSYTSVALDTSTGITTFSNLSRGPYNSDGWAIGTAHAIDAMVQQAQVLDGNPIDLMKTLLNLAGLADADLNVAAFTTERDDWFPGVRFRAILHQPIKIKALLNELRLHTLTSLWQGDAQQITIKFLGPNRPGQAYRRIDDAMNIIGRSASIDDHEERRITRLSIYYDLFAGKSGGNPDEYAQAVLAIDAAAESATEYAEVRWGTPIYSRWTRTLLGAESYDRTIAGRTLIRFRDGGKGIRFDLELKDETLAMGEIFELATRDIADFDGAPKVVRYQVTKRERRSAGRITYTAIDTRLKARYGWVAAAGTPNYASASAAQRERCFVASGASPTMSNGDEPYLII